MERESFGYPYAPISTSESLAKALGLNENSMLDISNRVPELHCPGPKQPKKDGTYRETHNAKELLKHVHRRIKLRLLKRVVYPSFLVGSLPNDHNLIRGTKGHIHPHLACSVVISEDVENFFPCIEASSVNSIWRHIFGFAPEVAHILTRLTTFDEVVPQGWIPSSYLANMALWREETSLVIWCQCRGIEYTRYVDDIVTSSAQPLSNEVTSELIQRIHAMLHRAGYKMKRSKHVLAREGQQKTIAGQHINRYKPTLPKQTRAKVRAAVHQCENYARNGVNKDQMIKAVRSATGRINYLSDFHPNEAGKLRERLERITKSN